MRRTLAVGLICVLAATTLVSLVPVPWPPGPQPARLDADIVLEHDAPWFGGLSGIDMPAGPDAFLAITDRGHIIRGQLARDGGHLTAATVASGQPLFEEMHRDRKFPYTDAEDLTITADGRIHVSFEHAQRVLHYDHFGARASSETLTRAWRALGPNLGLEALAANDAGVLFTIPEGILTGARDALVYRRFPDGEWEQPFTLPVSDPFSPVGADFGPDGLLYVLERDFRYGGFRTQVRRMTISDDGISKIETVLITPLFRHTNLEGLAVWRDADGLIRLTMVSDNNFLPFLSTRIVEYVIEP